MFESCRQHRLSSWDFSAPRNQRLRRDFAGTPNGCLMDVALTPVMRQYREAKAQHPDGILLFRLGDFYEIFFEDAEVAAPVMGVTLTSRPLGKSGRAPMCGVPHHAWQVYVGKLLRAGHKAVICDQTGPPRGHDAGSPGGRGVVRRNVPRVLTPGPV